MEILKTQIEFARDMQITPQMEQVGKEEGFEPVIIREKVASGQIVIPNNPVKIGDIAKYPDRRENEKCAALSRRDKPFPI